jgi:hypothetical protein
MRLGRNPECCIYVPFRQLVLCCSVRGLWGLYAFNGGLHSVHGAGACSTASEPDLPSQGSTVLDIWPQCSADTKEGVLCNRH